ncbi:outer membrane lipoprotein-sorting protein [Candidatus Kaiserbacteria bacterium]|nr:MAG: outer membrane lipoprotein-sorting protein [Candidatus Kaiserbacteria bacterium]
MVTLLERSCRFFLGFFLVSLWVISSSSASKSVRKGYKIAKFCQDANAGYVGEQSKATMVLETRSGQQVRRELIVKRREKRGDGDQSLLTFMRPADVKGTKLLTWTHLDSGDDQWVYLPAYRKVKRISSRLKTGSFLGSEFSYEDLGGRNIEKFRHRFLKEGKYKGRKVWVLEQKPKDKYSGYSKQIVWMDKKYKSPLKVEYFDRKGELLKVAKFIGYRRIDEWWRPSRTEMRNVQTRKKSTLVWKKTRLKRKFSSRDFQKEYLKK